MYGNDFRDGMSFRKAFSDHVLVISVELLQLLVTCVYLDQYFNFNFQLYLYHDLDNCLIF